MTNPIGIHALVWVGGWSPDEARTAIESTREAGYDLIELTMPDVKTFDADMTAKLLQENGLQSGFSLGLSEETDISSEDAECVARGRAMLADVVSLTRDVGGHYLGGVIFSKLGRYAAPVTARGRATRSSRSPGSPTRRPPPTSLSGWSSATATRPTSSTQLSRRSPSSRRSTGRMSSPTSTCTT